MLVAVSMLMLLHTAAIDAARVAKIAARSMSYEQNFAQRVGANYLVLLVSDSARSESAQACAALQQGFAPLQGVRVQGIPLATQEVDIKNAAQWLQSPGERKPDAVIICAGAESAARSKLADFRKAHILSVACTRDAMKSGFSLGIFEENGQISLMVNVQNAASEGIHFSEQLLKIAAVVP